MSIAYKGTFESGEENLQICSSYGIERIFVGLEWYITAIIIVFLDFYEQTSCNIKLSY